MSVTQRASFGKPKRYRATYSNPDPDPMLATPGHDPFPTIELGEYANVYEALDVARDLRSDSDPMWVHAYWPEVDKWEQAWPIR